ncbi:MAG: HAD family hydrolase [Acidobacteriota bacterium]|nr:HAD family hydrolase [Acidobacteriota bacterium]
MDGVLIRDEAMIEGADRFLAWLDSTDRSYLIITNNSMFTPRELSDRLRGLGLDVPAHRLWTSAMATAQFVATQRPAGTAFVIGEASLHEALAEVGYTERADRPDYVVLGECPTLSFDEVTTAVRLIEKGSRFVATNPEPTGPSADGAVPAVGAMAAMIERATGVAPYFVGKPNPMMIREALHRLDAHSSNTVLVGDRMETDILAGIEAGLTTVLVLSGVTSPADVDRYPYGPSRVVRSLAELVDAAL